MSECSSFIICARPYKETSLLLDVFTPEYGVITLVANGAKRNTAKFGSSLQPFYLNHLQFYGKNDLKTLQGIEPLAYYDLGVNNICGLYLNELIYRVLPKYDPCQKLFESYQQTIINLSKGFEAQKSLRLFEKQIFATIGYGFDFHGVVVDRFYIYKFEDGLVEVSSAVTNSISGRSLLSLANYLDDELYVEHKGQILQEVKVLMRTIIKYHLGTKRLFSKEVLLSL